MGVEEMDAVIAVAQTDGRAQVFIATRDGMSIRFPEEDVRPMGRTAYGVRGISLRDNDEVVAMEVVPMEVVGETGTILSVTANGYGKRTAIDEYRLQSRGGVGIINIQTSERNGQVVGTAWVHDGDEIMVISQQGKVIRMATSDIRTIGRATQGVTLLNLADDEEGGDPDRVVSIVRLANDPEAVAAQGDAPSPEPAEPAEPAEAAQAAEPTDPTDPTE
jgi:DNA gyrase subunit A